MKLTGQSERGEPGGGGTFSNFIFHPTPFLKEGDKHPPLWGGSHVTPPPNLVTPCSVVLGRLDSQFAFSAATHWGKLSVIWLGEEKMENAHPLEGFRIKSHEA